MEMKENLDVEVNMKEILATILRAGKKIIAVALVLAILFGAYTALDYYVLQGDPDQLYAEELEAYEEKKQSLQDAWDRANRDLISQRDYNENSPMMRIDPYNKYTTTLVFVISNINIQEVTEPFNITQNPISFVITRIQLQYLALWEGLDLSAIVEGTSYSGVADKYLREVISLTPESAGVQTLSVVGSNAAECEQLARKLYDALLQNREMISQATYNHSCTMLSEPTTGSSIDLELETLQSENRSKLKTKESSAAKSLQSLNALEMPSANGGVEEIVTNGLIGAILGIFLAIVWQVLAYFTKGSVSGAKQMMTRYSLIHLGSLMQRKGLWNRLGYRVMGEKLWKDREQAGAYIREKTVNHLPEEGTVVIATTLDTVDESVQDELAALVGAKGHKVTFVADATHNPEALAAISQCSGIVLAEQVFVSRNVAVKELLGTAKELDKPVYGFVLL